MRVCPVSEVSSSAARTSRTFESANAVPFADAFGRCVDPAAGGAAVPFGGTRVGTTSARAGALMPVIACTAVGPRAGAGLAAGAGCIATLGARPAGTIIGGAAFAIGVGAACAGATFAAGTSACTGADFAGPWISRAGASALRTVGGVSTGGAAAARGGAEGIAACTVGTLMAGDSKDAGAATGTRAGFGSTGRAMGAAACTGA